MAYKLIIMKDDQVLKEHALIAEKTHIGRRQHNDVVLEDPTVSGKHAMLRTANEQVELEDVGSTNGTYVNGDLIEKNARLELQLGDRIVIGPYRLSLQLQMEDAWAPGSSVSPTLAVDRFEDTSRPSLLGQDQTAEVHILSGANAGRTLPLTKVVTTVGTPSVGVVSFTHRLNTYVLTKLEGDGPLRVNGEPMSSNAVKLKDGDRISLASIEMLFQVVKGAV